MRTSNLALVILSMVLAFYPAIPIHGETEGEHPDLAGLIGKTIRIETSGRGNFTGVLLAVGQDRVELEGSDGEIIQISRMAIERYRELTPGKKGRAFYQDSAANRLIFAPTAFSMEPGEFHIADHEIALVTASYGMGKHVSFWGGISPAGALLSGRFIAPIGESFAVSAGSFAAIEWLGAGGGPVSGLLLPYSLFSWGKSNNNITAGGGAAFWFNADTGSEMVGVVAVLGGKLVLTATTALVTENWIVWGKLYADEILDHEWYGIPLVAASGLIFRIAGNRFSWDIGAVLPLMILDETRPAGTARIRGAFDGLWIPIPWISVTYRIR